MATNYLFHGRHQAAHANSNPTASLLATTSVQHQTSVMDADLLTAHTGTRITEVFSHVTMEEHLIVSEPEVLVNRALSELPQDLLPVYGGLSVSIGGLGVLCNCFMFSMMVSRELRMTSHGVCLGVMAGVNTLLLTMRIVHGTAMLTLKDRQASWVAGLRGLCGVVGLETALRCTHSWLMVLLALDRIISLCLPLLRFHLCTSTKAAIASAAIFVISFLAYAPASYINVFCDLAKVKNQADGVLASSVCIPLISWLLHNKYFNIFLTYIIPIVLITVASFVLIYKVRQRIKVAKMVKVTENMQFVMEKISMNNHLTISMLCVFFKFIITRLPMTVALLGFTAHPDMKPGLDMWNSTSPTETATVPDITDHGGVSYAVLYHSAELVCSANEAFCLITMLCSSKYFRRVFYQIICSRDVNFEAAFAAAEAKDLEDAERRLECSLPHSRTTCKRVVGLKMNSTSNSLRRAHVGDVIIQNGEVTPESNDADSKRKKLKIAVISGKEDGSVEKSPTELILTETAMKLSALGGTFSL